MVQSVNTTAAITCQFIPNNRLVRVARLWKEMAGIYFIVAGAEVILSEPVSFANKEGYILGCSGQWNEMWRSERKLDQALFYFAYGLLASLSSLREKVSGSLLSWFPLFWGLVMYLHWYLYWIMVHSNRD